jgi:hypothetical protein
MGAAVEHKMDPEPGSWQWDAPTKNMLELEREDAQKTGVRGAPKALEVVKSPDSDGNPRKEKLELTGGGDIVVPPAISTAAAPVEVGNRELEEAAGAVAVHGIAGKLPGVVEKAGFGWLEEEAVAKAGPPLLDAGAAQSLPSVFLGNDIQRKVCLEVCSLDV